MSDEVSITIGSSNQLQVRVFGSVVGEFYNANNAINIALWLNENIAKLGRVFCTYGGD